MRRAIKYMIFLAIGVIYFNGLIAQSVVFNNVYNDYSYLKYNSTEDVSFYNNEALYRFLEINNSYSLFGSGASLYSVNYDDSVYVYGYNVVIDEFGDTLKTKRLDTDNKGRDSQLDAIILNNRTYSVGFTQDSSFSLESLNGTFSIDNESYIFNLGEDNKFVTIKTNDNGQTFQVLAFADVDTGGINYDAFISTIDSNGNLISNMQFGGTENDFLYGLEYLDNGNYFVVGHTYSQGVGGADLWLLEVDNTGTIIWEKTYGSFFYDRIENSKGIVRKGNFIYLAGQSSDTLNSQPTDVGWMMKLDLQGNVIWDKKYIKGSSVDKFIGIQIWDDNSFIIGGGTQSYDAPNEYPIGWLLKVDTFGNIIWDRDVVKYNDQTNLVHHYSADMLVTQDKGILIGGYIIANSIVDENGYFHRNDAWLAKTDSCGFTTGDIPEPMLLIDSIYDKTVYITDQSKNYCTGIIDWGDGTALQEYYAYENNEPLAVKHFSHTYNQIDNYTIKTTTLAGEEFRDYEVEVLGLSSESVISNAERNLLSLFPNPANDYVIVQNRDSFLQRNDGSFKMTIHNINGKQVKTVNLNSKLYQQKVNVSSLNNGVYLVRFELGGQLVGTEKLVIAR